MNIKKRNRNGISSSGLGLMAGSKVAMMAVSFVSSSDLGSHTPYFAVVVILSHFCSFSGQGFSLLVAHSW